MDEIQSSNMVTRLLCIISIFISVLSCSSDNSISPKEIIVGEWSVEKYNIEPDNFGELAWKTIICDERGNFKVIDRFGDIAIEGSYEIGDAYLRLDFQDGTNRSDRILAQIINFTETTLVLYYKDTENDIAVQLWLKKHNE